MDRILGGMVIAAGLFSVMVLGFAGLRAPQTPERERGDTDSVCAVEASVRLLAVGDVNLARETGKRILGGDTLWPFQNVLREFSEHDIVFLNLESNLSNQNGETQDPENNLIFTGPPAGAWSLRHAGVSVVSTANNHALDYGRAAKDSTMRYLRQAGVLWAGTAAVRDSLYEPAIITRKGIRFAFFAVTAIMNMSGEWWKGHVAYADTGNLFPHIRAWRPVVDVVVVSYHGGNEYEDRPHRSLRAFADAVLQNGADLFLGHHPHVPYGLVETARGIGAHSLGNFAFNQNEPYWTRRSFGLSVTFARDGDRIDMREWNVLPVRAGYQPAFLPPGAEADTVVARVVALSSSGKSETVSWK